MLIQVNARNRTCSFEGREDESILHSGLRSAVKLPYECSTGTCGTCKAKLVKGRFRDAWPQAPGHKYVKAAQGEFLMCQALPESDVEVEVATFVHTLDPAAVPQRAGGSIRRASLLTRDVMHLEVETERPMDFEAGQFVGLAIPDVPGFRGYSMVNFERHARRLHFVIKKKPGGGISEWLFDPAHRVESTPVELFGPLGHATFHHGIAQNLLVIAGGSGIAGMMSILARAREERYFDRHEGFVFFGVRTYADTFYLKELEEHAAAFPGRLTVVVALSDEPVPASAASEHPALGFEQGFVHEVAARRMKGRYANIRAYLAGPPPAVDAAIRTLIVEAKLTTDNIAYDKFS
jgi:toluene monooxygenase electron transfer component